MMFKRFSVLAVLTLSACAGSVPDSNPNAGTGVGFGGYDAYAQERAEREAALSRQRVSPVPEEQMIASETLGVLGIEPTMQQPVPVQTAALDTDNPNISDEQDFQAVSSRETIESDRERLQQQQAAYEVATPEAVPTRPSNTAPNVVAFALTTNNALGQSIYRRSGSKNQSRFDRACARYASPDQAQSAFLALGGPEKDPKGLDPDGDGFACYWDPTPFRAARGG